ncbi:hypothetical protein [Cupriavidus taiwanensis]|nr:hypothetical protein [Cupriavidus taiwanensis]
MNQPEQGQPRLFAQLPLLDGILEQHRVQLGADFITYRYHAYRVANFCSALAPLGSNYIHDFLVRASRDGER